MPVKTRHSGRLIAVATLCLLAAACNRTPQSTATEPSPSDPATPGITFKSDPNPPRAGDNKYEVTVRQTDGAPVTDAEVSVTFYMPAMPSMNMPEMHDKASLKHVEKGRYQGSGHLVMAGTWNVSIEVSRSGQILERKKFSVISK